MFITHLELPAADLEAQGDFYADTLELPVALGSEGLEVRAGHTHILFTQAEANFDGAYHFAFNIPSNQFQSAKRWLEGRLPLLRDNAGAEEFKSQNWNSDSVYFKDAAGNILEFIARYDLDNAVDGDFDSDQVLIVSEIGLPSENVTGLAEELCTRLGLSVFRQAPNENFTPVGDDHGLFILPIRDRIWMPDSGLPAQLLPVVVRCQANSAQWEVTGVPYEIRRVYPFPAVEGKINE